MSLVNVFRTDIQAMRALAVLLVLIFHIWPTALPAGYIGVDIFFVISGYLITGVLFREISRSGHIRYLRFYINRFRRLVPAASLVILVTVVLSFLLDPPYRHQDTAIEAIGSALYFQNWVLAWRATDYLAAEESLGPLKHYWSLSVEEQFYLIWPAALMLGVLFSRKAKFPARRAALVSISFISGASLIASAYYANEEMVQGYFVTFTRLWELGLGALLALTQLSAPAGRKTSVLPFACLAIIVLFSFITPAGPSFPGLIALPPTLSCAVFIHYAAGMHPGRLRDILELRVIQVIGDASYSIYLWHWPIVYFATSYLFSAESTGVIAGLFLTAASIFAGMASKRWIEDRYRSGRASHTDVSDRMAVQHTFGAFAASIAFGGLLYMYAASGLENDKSFVMDSTHPGATILTQGVEQLAPADLIPPLTGVKKNEAVIYDNGCHTPRNDASANFCELSEGLPGKPLVVVVGDSHAANWVPMVHELATSRNWKFISVTASGCALYYYPENAKNKNIQRCAEWSAQVMEKIAQLAPDMVILGRMRRPSDYASDSLQEALPGRVITLTTVLSDLSRLTDNVIVMHDIPRLKMDLLECLSRSRDCGADATQFIDPPDPLVLAAKRSGAAEIIDLRDMVCPQNICPAVIGNVIVWRDHHHLTASYARSIAPEFSRRIDALLSENQGL